MKKNTNTKTGTKKSPPAVGGKLPTKSHDLDAWNIGVYEYDSVEAALAGDRWPDGIHRIAFSSSNKIDVYAQDLSLLEGSGRRVLLVGLSGAVSNRNGKSAPFFSGREVARELNLPLVSVSDPTLAIDAQLPISWYAGSSKFSDISTRMCEILDGLAVRHNAQLLIFGGSGGGFAGLRLATLLTCQAQIVVWNPQTAIANYSPDFVIQYLSAAFPSLREDLKKIDVGNSENAPLQLRRLLNSTEILHDVCGLDLMPNLELVYLQNRTDHHVARHAAPYLAHSQFQRNGPASFVCQSARCTVYFGHWGIGHAAPPANLLAFLLSKLACGVPCTKAILELDEGLSGIVERSAPFLWHKADSSYKPTAEAWKEHGKVYVECHFPVADTAVSSAASAPRYAFYLLVNGERKAVQWYQSSPQMTFDIPGEGGNVEIRVFFQDDLGGRVSIKIPVREAA